MIKLCIKQSDKKQFQNIFKFFIKFNCELCIFPEGLKYRTDDCEGIIYSEAFAEYNFNQRHKLGVFSGDNKKITNWFSSWKDVKGSLNTEIPIN